MGDPRYIDLQIADLYERLAVLLRERANTPERPRRRPLVELANAPSRAAIDNVRRGLRRKGIVT